jgi:Zn-dependent protease with chaperone function
MIFYSELIGILITTGIYTVSLILSFSNLGESIIRRMVYARRLTTGREITYLVPLFHAVYKQAIKRNPNIGKKIKLYIIEDNEINAFAIGKNTICITTKSIIALSQEEIKGLLAHEFGHIAHGHTKALLLDNIGNGIFSVFIAILNFFIRILYMATHVEEENELGDVFKFFYYSIFYLLKATIFIIEMPKIIITRLNSRKNEYNADYFAYEIGFGSQLAEVLYILLDLYGDNLGKISDTIKSSHPYTSVRIKRLEQLISGRYLAE